MALYALAPFSQGMDFSEAMGVVITGLAVVFLVLLVLVAVFYLMGLFFAPKKPKVEKTEAPSAKAVPAPVKQAPSGSSLSVVAAITAALNEYLGGNNFIIKKIRPAKKGKKASDPWSADGRAENTKPF